jgi:hypothetical protein
VNTQNVLPERITLRLPASERTRRKLQATNARFNLAASFPRCPRHFNADQKAEFRVLREVLAPAGFVTAADRWLFEVLASSIARYHWVTPAMKEADAPAARILLTIQRGTFADIVSMAHSLKLRVEGYTPRRRRARIPKPKIFRP